MQNWERLFIRAFQAIKSSGLPEDSWTWGGGTSLMLEFRHRLSKDIDIFISDPQLIGYAE